MTCANGHAPLWEYACRSLPIAAKSSNVRGHDTDTGNDAKESTTRSVESGKRMITKSKGALTEASGELATRSATLPETRYIRIQIDCEGYIGGPSP